MATSSAPIRRERPFGVVLNVPTFHVRIRWRAELDDTLRERLASEVRALAWTLSELEALLFDAHRVTGLDHAWLAPRFDLRLPLFDAGRRFRIVMSQLDSTRIAVVDEEGKRVADVRLQ